MPDANLLDPILRRAAATAAYADHSARFGSSIDSWPVTEKAAVKRDPGVFKTGVASHVRIASSGTTGTPMPWYRTVEEDADNTGAVADVWRSLLPGLKRFVSVLDHNTAAAGHLLEAAAERNCWTLLRGFPYRIGGPRMDLLAEAFAEFAPEVVVATPSGLIDIEEAWRVAGGFEAGKSSVHAILLIGAPATPGMRTRLARAWDASTFIASFGSTELGTIACGCAVGELHVLEGRHLLELRQDGALRGLEVGKVGELIVTPMRSEAMQVVRYASGDTVACVECRCGAGGRAISIAGRNDDLVLVRDLEIGPEGVEEVIFTKGGAGDYLLEIDELDRVVGVQLLALGDESVELDSISSELDAPVRIVDHLPALARAGGAVKSWRRTRTVRVYSEAPR